MATIACFSCSKPISGQAAQCSYCRGPFVTTFHKNGKLQSRYFSINGVLDGLWEGFYENGQLEARGEYKNGKREGLWVEYYDDGDLLGRTHYKNGTREGFAECFADYGLSHRGNYKNGKKEGVWEFFNWGSLLRGTLTYKKGAPTFSEDFHENGQLQSRCTHTKDFELVGLHEEFHTNGLLENRFCYGKDGELLWKQKFNNGVLQEEDDFS